MKKLNKVFLLLTTIALVGCNSDKGLAKQKQISGEEAEEIAEHLLNGDYLEDLVLPDSYSITCTEFSTCKKTTAAGTTEEINNKTHIYGYSKKDNILYFKSIEDKSNEEESESFIYEGWYVPSEEEGKLTCYSIVNEDGEESKDIYTENGNLKEFALEGIASMNSGICSYLYDVDFEGLEINPEIETYSSYFGSNNEKSLQCIENYTFNTDDYEYDDRPCKDDYKYSLSVYIRDLIVLDAHISDWDSMEFEDDPTKILFDSSVDYSFEESSKNVAKLNISDFQNLED